MTRYNILTLGCAPLHTERPDWANHAPAQIQAILARRPHGLGITEARGPIMADCQAVADRMGYAWYVSAHDAHRQVAFMIRKHLHVISFDDVVVNNNHRICVTFDFHGSENSVFVTHWERHDNEGALIQTHSLIDAMHEKSHGTGKAFYVGDGNPSLPQRAMSSQPGALLADAGMPTVWRELHLWPTGLGVNLIGHNLADPYVKTLSAVTYDPLGSDHVPAIARFRIRRAA